MAKDPTNPGREGDDPQALLIRTAGTNCDRELAHAFEQAGATTRLVHMNELVDHPRAIADADLIGLPGGFSYGDDIAAGRIFANRLRHRLWEPLHDAVCRGTPIIGVCNGFQVLVKLGLLPNPNHEGEDGSKVTLVDNHSGRFVDRWVGLRVPSQTMCIWTRGLDKLELPIAHGEGRFVASSPTQLDQLNDDGQIALRYDSDNALGGNPNGSESDVAGICDPSGVVLGLMPHPERWIHQTHHPLWTRANRDPATPAGLQMFRNAVEHARQLVGCR